MNGYRITDQQAVHFITFATVQWIDVFTRECYKQELVDSLIFCQNNKGLKVNAWCIMPNHLHLIISAKENYNLSDIIRDFKRFTSTAVIRCIETNEKESRKNWMLWIFKKAGEKNKRNHNYQFWQQDNHPIECGTPEILLSRQHYLHENPVRAGIVYEAASYKYSSGIDYYTNRNGLIILDR